MTGYFSSYNVAVIDASLFVHELSVNFINELKAVKYIYVAGTFNAEMQSMMELMPSRREECENNIRMMRQELHPKEMNLSAYPQYNNDIWDFLNLIAERPNADKAVLITGSLGLIQRVISCGLGIDIFDLNRMRLIGHVAYHNLAKRYFVDNDDRPASETETDNIEEGSLLFTGSGFAVKLDEMLGDGFGSEGNVYYIGGTSRTKVGKIFKTGKFPANKYRAVLQMIANKELQALQWAMFPIDVLYADPERKQPVGIVEPFGHTGSSMYDDELFFGDTGNWTTALLSVKVSDLLCLCEYITRQVCYLNGSGVFISDYNIKNFDYPLNRSDRFIQMWDTDSFGYGNYFSGYMADNDKSKNYDITRREDVCRLCNDELYNFLFQLLTLGDVPYNPDTGEFNYLTADYGNYVRKDFVPASIWNLFEKFYTGKTKASPQMMLYLFREEIRKRNTNAVPDYTFAELVDKIEPGFLERQNSEIDGVISPALNLNPYGRHTLVSSQREHDPPGNQPHKPPETEKKKPPVDPPEKIIKKPPGKPSVKPKRHGCFTSILAALAIVLAVILAAGGFFG